MKKIFKVSGFILLVVLAISFIDINIEGKSFEITWGRDSYEYAEDSGEVGESQSPIDISSNTADIGVEGSEVVLNLKPELITVKETEGPLITFYPQEYYEQPVSSIEVDGEMYEWQETQLHMPSEHTIDGEHYAMEMEWIFENESGQYTVLSVMVTEGEENNVANTLLEEMESDDLSKGVDVETPVSIMGLFPIENLGAYQYMGSLTTPPYTESVNWVVYKEPITMSKEQLDEFAKYIDNTNRPTQETNDRTVNTVTTTISK